MAASQPRRGASEDQGQSLYTIRPLRWRRSVCFPGQLYAVSAVGAYYINDVARCAWRVSLEFSGTLVSVAGSATLRGAKVAATADLNRRLKYSLKPAGKAVRRG